MAIFIMETRVSVESLRQPRSFEALERGVAGYLEKACPEVKWLGSYATLGPYDYLDIFEANDNETAMRVSVLVRAYGHGEATIRPAVDWGRFKHLVRNLPELPPV
ncbi:GYD domain-containing protein [Cupriavidus sp. L7L]|uniref:GYD domain-containing protein n=1 Tax=Cupriavidus sp. L7L TaxID=2546443 RepID=UPI0010544D89|nr:GYD domain-containing protein [Cupriavidus sp. L7L]TDF67232.1 GYD domain-containing protein [Cupriavidus sp. L7L]